MHPATRSGDLALIEFEVEIEVLKSVILDRPAGFPQRKAMFVNGPNYTALICPKPP